MRTRNIILALLTLNPVAASADFKVHEWGTFTSLLGSNGVSQQGMYHEDEKLPEFVYNFGDMRQPGEGSDFIRALMPPRHPCDVEDKGCFPRDFLERNAVTQKMETPVIYFYNNTGHRVRATVDVRFPEGVISQTYPAPVFTFPTRESEPVIANGHTVFDVQVSTEQFDKIPAVPAGNIYGYARNVASNIVRSGSDVEKFIFYRGLGRFQPVTQITSTLEGLRIHQPKEGGDIPAAFLVHVNEAGRPALWEIGSISADQEYRISREELETFMSLNKRTAPENSRGEIGQLVSALDAAGLNRDEAQAMIDTWLHGYLGTPGLRVLYILPRQEVESILPLTVNASVPVDELERVFVGRIEVLLASQEKALLEEFLRLGDLFNPESLGRMAHPILVRLQEVYLEQGPGDKVVMGRFHRMIHQVADL